MTIYDRVQLSVAHRILRDIDEGASDLAAGVGHDIYDRIQAMADNKLPASRKKNVLQTRREAKRIELFREEIS
jgi:hypothetical protein